MEKDWRKEMAKAIGETFRKFEKGEIESKRATRGEWWWI